MLHMRLTRLHLLLAGADKSAKQLCSDLSISQPTLSRLMAKSTGVIAYGPKSATRYTVTLEQQGLVPCPMYRVDPCGMITPVGTLVPVLRGRFVVIDESGAKALHDSLPWYVQDVRPQGFIGARFAHAHADLHLPESVREWTDQHILTALSQRGEDLPGNLIIGSASLERYLGAAPPLAHTREEYGALASAAIAGEINASSAGGEHPKFLCYNGLHQLLVKFSAPISGASASPAARRWADLLVCEAIANQVLTAHGIAGASTTALQAGGRMVLESVRFDRTAAGRVGMVSLAAVDAEYLGLEKGWLAAAEVLFAQKRIDAATLATVRILDLFGRMIGNSDMHSGNLSFLTEDFQNFRLAPVYDMTPMMYAPSSQGEISIKEFRPPTPAPTSLTAWRAARVIAAEFWTTVAAHPEVSANFKEIAVECGLRLMGLDRAAAMLAPTAASTRT